MSDQIKCCATEGELLFLYHGLISSEQNIDTKNMDSF